MHGGLYRRSVHSSRAWTLAMCLHVQSKLCYSVVHLYIFASYTCMRVLEQLL